MLLAEVGLTDPAERLLADIVVPLATGEEVGTVLAPAHPMPFPVVWLAWLPVPEERRQQQARKLRWNGSQVQEEGAVGQNLKEC